LQVDLAALERQIAERKAQEEEQHKRDETFDKKRICDANIALLLEKRTEEVIYSL
jgi:hypothetical protein